MLCSSTPARTRCSTYSRSRASSTTESMPARAQQLREHQPGRPGADDRRPASARSRRRYRDDRGAHVSTTFAIANTMAEIAPARRRGRRAGPRRRRRRAGGLHAPDPVRGRPRDHPPGPPRPDADPDDAGRHLRPADRRGLRAQAGLLLGRQPGRRLAAPLPRRGRARLAARRSRSRSTATPGMANRYVAGASGLPFAVLRGYAGTDLPRAHRRRRGRSPARSPARSSPPCPRCAPTSAIVHAQRGRPRRATCSCGASPACRRRRCSPAQRSLVTVEEIVDELEPRPGAVVLPGWAIDRGRRGARRRAALLRAGLLRARQRLLPGVGRDQPRPRRASRQWMREELGA